MQEIERRKQKYFEHVMDVHDQLWYDVLTSTDKRKEDTMQKIDMQKKYRVVGTHEPVRIICVDRKGKYPILLLCESEQGVETVFCLDEFGMDFYGDKIIEEVPEVDWSKVEVDTLIFVGNTPRYFAGYEHGKVYYFKHGATSKTSDEKYEHGWSAARFCSLEEPK